MKALYFDCYSGISGDMILGALIDAGLNLDDLKSELKKLNVEGWDVTASPIKRCGITGTKFDVITDKSLDKARHLHEIEKIINESSLSDKIKSKAIKIFHIIGDAESEVHGSDHHHVHFHEVGALDAIIDITGAVIGMDLLGIKEVYSSNVTVGNGTITIAHGEVSVPAPATTLILKDIPLKRSDIQGELTTPTGASILKAYAKSFTGMPNNFSADAVGYGAGGKEYEGKTNYLRVMLGEIASQGSGLESHSVYKLTTEIDDMNPEIFSSLMEEVFKLGCLDCHYSSVQMKKNRPGTKLEILTAPDNKNKIMDYVFRNTSTFGIRVEEVQRYCLKREKDFVETEYGKIQVKKGFIGDELIKVSPEYESCKQAAAEYGVSVMKVYNGVIRLLK